MLKRIHHFGYALKAGTAAALVLLLALLLVACGGSDDETNGQTVAEGGGGMGKVLWTSESVDSGYPTVLTVEAEPNPEVPQVDVKLAQAPYNDHSYQSIGIKNGWYEESGITIEPKPMGKSLDMEQMAPALIAGEIEVGTMANVVWIAALDQTTDQKMFTYADTFLGHAILGNPDGNYRTFAEFMDEGMSFKEAIKAAMEQVAGKTYAYSPETSQRPFQQYVFGQAGMSFDDTENLVLDDPKIVELATGGRTDFASPVSGPLTTQLLREGWVPVVTVQDMVNTGDAEALESSIINSGLAATEGWLADNHETALRMAGVSHRIIQHKQDDQLEAAKIQIPYLNSIAGTEFTPADSKYLDEQVDPFFIFEEQAEFFEDEGSPWFYMKNATAAIEAAEEAGTLKPGHNPDEIILADDTWKELKSLSEAAKKIIDKVSATNPSGEAQKYLAEAEVFYDAFNFLDALRFAGAAEMAA